MVDWLIKMTVGDCDRGPIEICGWDIYIWKFPNKSDYTNILLHSYSKVRKLLTNREGPGDKHFKESQNFIIWGLTPLKWASSHFVSTVFGLISTFKAMFTPTNLHRMVPDYYFVQLFELLLLFLFF
jgi:hypothetical protein